MKNLEEAVEELALAEDSEKIPYLIGEVFICQGLEDTLVSTKTISIIRLINLLISISLSVINLI
jgi:hypothetical protein